jgi:hypothetical protein
MGRDPGFDVDNDQRKFAVKNYHRLDAGRNISLSVDVELRCLACRSPHSIAEGLGAGRAQVFVVSDQAFPALLPTDDGRCLVVVRVEDGALSELVSVFCDIFARNVSPAGSLPPGSVVLLGSLSHLSMRGLCNYTEELVRNIGSLAARVGTGVEVVPLVFTFLGGVGDPGVVRDAYDLDAWIMSSPLGPGVGLGAAHAALWGSVRGLVGGGEAFHSGRSLYLPTSFRNPRKKVFVSVSTDPPLPGSIPPFDKKMEGKVIFAMVNELVTHFGVKLNENPSLESGGVTPAGTDEPGRLIIVGASHMVRMSKHLQEKSVILAYPGFRATPQALTQLASRLEEIRPTPDDRLVLDLLSNSIFMGTDVDGLPTASVQGEGGTYHIPGSLTVAPVPVTKKILANCSQIGKLCSTVKHVTLISPIPRYITGKCCDDNNHVENYDNDDFETEIINGLEQQKRLLDVWAAEHQLCYRIVDVTELVDPVEPILRNRVTRTGIPLWSMWDPVHLADEAYGELSYAILNACDGDGDGPDDASCSSGGYSDRSHKRRRPDAVITTPLDPNPKRGKHGWRMKPAGWLLGQPERRRHVRPDDGPGPRGYRPYGPGGPGRLGIRGRGWGSDGFLPFGHQSRKGW